MQDSQEWGTPYSTIKCLGFFFDFLIRHLECGGYSTLKGLDEYETFAPRVDGYSMLYLSCLTATLFH